MKWRVYEETCGIWGWELIAHNGAVVGQSTRVYGTHAAARRSVLRIVESMCATRWSITTERAA